MDDRQVGPDGAAVRCSVCAEVFRVEPPDGVVTPPWQVRTIDDLLFTAPDLATLHSWILEGRLHPDDRVSRSGRHFVRLGEMPEFAEAFSGFIGLPGVLEAEAERGRSEQSALDVLGPPPAFGTHAGDDADAALEGVPESANLEHSAMLGRVLDESAASSSSFEAAGTEAAVVPRPREFGGSMPAAESPTGGPPPAPSGPRPAAGGSRHPTPVPGARPPNRPPTLPPARGVPALVHDDRGSRPMSMLDVVTQHVRPIAAPVVEATRQADSAPIVAGREAAREVVPPAAAATGPIETLPARRGGGWIVWGALGILAGAAVVFGIPQIRHRVLGTTPVAPPVARDDSRVLEDAAAALASADPQQLARADAALLAAIDAGGDRATLGVVLAEVLATRAVVHELWAAVEPAMRSDARFWAQEDAGRAATLLDARSASDDPVAYARAHALLRIVQGRADAAGLAVDEEGALLVAVAPLLRDPAAKLPDPVRTGLVGLGRPSVLARLVLALGHARAGDPAAARAVADAVLAIVPSQPVARAIARGVATDDPDGPIVVADGGTPDPDPTAEVPVDPVPTPTADPGESAERLIDRGCKKAESGDAAEALALLRKGLEKRPNDVDGSLCSGDAASRLGTYDVALRHYERALSRKPQMMSALAGAGKAAAKLGHTTKAVRFYERLLQQDPSHDQAREYVDAHKGSSADGGTDNG